MLKMNFRSVPKEMREIAWVGFVTIFRTEVRRCSRIWTQTLIPPMITMVLYLFIFGSIIGRKVGTIFDIPYIQFIGPGIIAMALINAAYSNVSSSFFSSKNHRYYEEMFVTPIPSLSIVAGYISGGICRGLIVMCLVGCVVFAFHPYRIEHLLVLVFASLMTSIIFSCLGMMNAIAAGDHDEANWVNNFVITPLTYMGGVFFPMSYLPAVIQPIAELNPILMVVSSFRYAILGISSGHTGIHLIGLAFLAFGLFACLVVMVGRRVRLGD